MRHGPRLANERVAGAACSRPPLDIDRVACRAQPVTDEVKLPSNPVTGVTRRADSATWRRDQRFSIVAIPEVTMKKRSIVIAAAGPLLGIAAAAAVPVSLLGQPAVPEQAQRTVVITPATRYVNVTEGDVVRFVAGDKIFAFDFDGSAASSFELNRVAPAGILDHTVTVYVGRNTATQP
jgi:hypothetical protein